MLFFFYFAALIDRAILRGTITPNTTWQKISYNGPTATLQYQVRVICDPDYYGDTCARYCHARDDVHGHYTCNPNGDKVCNAGWAGKYCDQGNDCLQIHCVIQFKPIHIVSL